jgi:hypothetical protein
MSIKKFDDLANSIESLESNELGELKGGFSDFSSIELEKDNDANVSVTVGAGSTCGCGC